MKKNKDKNRELTIQEADILSVLCQEPFVNQRILSVASGHSLGVVNRSLRFLIASDYLDKRGQLSRKGWDRVKRCAPRNAVILAAGFGMRMIPINLSSPKALLEVRGERLIERLISQLHEVGVMDITVVVGFMKDSFEYLIDEYGVELVYNPNFASTNNIHSLRLVLDKLSNTYIVPCDIWCDRNPFRNTELYSWYMVSDLIDEESSVRVNRKMELVSVSKDSPGNGMVGICYLLEDDAAVVRNNVASLCADSKHDNDFWERAISYKGKMIIAARLVHFTDVMEINTYEQLRELDSDSNQLQSEAIAIISDALGVKKNEIVNISVLKKGMTNRSFMFSCKGKKYIMRIPGEGTLQLINRRQETEVYRTIRDKNICDEIVYINPDNGYKITEFLDETRVCNPGNYEDVKKCMRRLREFHEMKLRVDHNFDIFEQIKFYEMLWDGTPSIYRDYEKTRENVFSLKSYIDSHVKEKVLTHIDAVPDNFLFVGKDKNEEIRLIDWEYAGMQDPHVDIAMFCIYSLYDKHEVDKLIAAYFDEGCDDETRTKIYCYMAACGLLWSNWCEYKRKLGVEFGEYSLRQYRYAKEYYRIVQTELKKKDGEW